MDRCTLHRLTQGGVAGDRGDVQQQVQLEHTQYQLSDRCIRACRFEGRESDSDFFTIPQGINNHGSNYNWHPEEWSLADASTLTFQFEPYEHGSNCPDSCPI